MDNCANCGEPVYSKDAPSVIRIAGEPLKFCCKQCKESYQSRNPFLTTVRRIFVFVVVIALIIGAMKYAKSEESDKMINLESNYYDSNINR